MPKYWYNVRDNIVKDGDDEETTVRKNFHRKITASNKPYFMTYVYPALKASTNKYQKNNEYGVSMRFAKFGIHTLQELKAYEPKTKEMEDYLDYYKKYFPVGVNPCVVNRICWIFENEFNEYLSKTQIHAKFDYSILKSNVSYTKKDYQDILNLYSMYKQKVKDYMFKSSFARMDEYDAAKERRILIGWFRRKCEEICSNEDELCDIVLDICYKRETTKQFAWDICSDVILKNLLKNNGYKINYPKMVKDKGEFEYCGENFVMCEKVIGGDEDDDIE